MEQKDKNPGILGVVADLIKVESSYETAIETALGGSIQNIVTDREETAKRMIEFLKRGKYGRATFLPLTAIGRKGNAGNKDAVKEPGILGVASTLVRTEEKYRALVRIPSWQDTCRRQYGSCDRSCQEISHILCGSLRWKESL